MKYHHYQSHCRSLFLFRYRTQLARGFSVINQGQGQEIENPGKITNTHSHTRARTHRGGEPANGCGFVREKDEQSETGKGSK